MSDLFVFYHLIPSIHGIAWLLEENQNAVVTHLLSTTCPDSVRQMLESDLEFVYHSIKKDFSAFMNHANTLAEAFQLIDNGN